MSKYTPRKDGRYYTLVSTGKFDENGKPVRIPVYAATSRRLEAEVGRIKTDLERGSYADDKGKTFGTYADEWFSAYKEKNVSAATARDYKNILKNHIDLIKDIRLKELTKTDIQNQLSSKESHEVKRRLKLTVNQILECAMEDGLIYKNVAHKIKLPSTVASEKRPLTEAEKTAIKDCSFTPMEKIFVNILYGCGLRRGEVLALMINNIDFVRGGINITHAVTFVGGTTTRKVPKTNTSIRFVNAPQWLLEELKSYCAQLPGLYLFHGVKGQIISDASYRRMWKSIFQKINTAMGGTDELRVTDLTPHVFRHNYATQLFYLGFKPKEAQKLLGHSSVRVTLDIYTHLVENQKEMNERINAIAL